MKHYSIKHYFIKHYFITGASDGIGAALAKRLLNDGHKVSGVARRKKYLDAIAKEHPLFLPLIGDVTDPKRIAQAINQAKKHHGAIDTLILNAGLYIPQDASKPNIDTFKKHIDVNYMGAVNTLAAALPHMLKRKTKNTHTKNTHKGQIVIMASVAGWVGLPQAAAYGPSKAALISLAESLWFDLTPKGLKVQIVCPGFVKTQATAINDFYMPALMHPDDAAQALIKGMKSTQFEITFPKRFTRIMRLLRHIPYWLFFKIIRIATRN